MGMKRAVLVISARVASRVSRYRKPRLFRSVAPHASVDASKCLAMWQLVEPRPMMIAGVATLCCVPKLSRACEVTINPPEFPPPTENIRPNPNWVPVY